GRTHGEDDTATRGYEIRRPAYTSSERLRETMPVLISRRALRILRVAHAFLLVAGLALGAKLLLEDLDLPPHGSHDWIDLQLPNGISALWFAWLLSFLLPTIWLLVRPLEVWVVAIGYAAAITASVPFSFFAWAPLSAPIERVQKE